ncbi:MAG: T9SS type A sorting domain-containing protein [Bacteroidia bacterium]|nr:T9SS type A sorting domain-containing protein [Bacteroidia bacterium]
MKNIIYIITAFLFLSIANAGAQNSPVWTRNINALPDTISDVYPVRTINDAANNIYVLSTHYNSASSAFKIYLNKYTDTGTLLWNLIYDNNGNGHPRGFDMEVDNAGNCYIAGGFMATPNYKPLLMKVNSAGSVAWMRDSTTSFNTGLFDQLLLKNNILSLSSGSGVATFDVNGNALWSNNLSSWRIAVDNAGQMIVSGFDTTSNNIFRFNSAGVLNFSDNSIYYATRIAADIDNSFYLLTGSSQYELVKYDSAGIFQWSTNSFPSAPPFGDYSFDVLVDYNNDVILTGISDTMFKFSPSGNLIWSKTMNGLDNYLSSAKITFSNLLAIAGTILDSGGYDMSVSMFDINGNQNWQGYYDGNTGGQEFTVDMTIDNSGIYVVENNNNNTTLVKFDSPFLSAIDYSLICVDSVWYDTLNPTFINVSIFNGNPGHLNYPSVQIVSPASDTIGNPSNWVSFFAHIGNSYQIYSDTITQLGITDFNSYIFLIREGFGATTAVINWCGPVAIHEMNESSINIFPNPVSDILYIHSPANKIFNIDIYNTTGKKIFDKKLSSDAGSGIDVSSFADGIYFLRLREGKNLRAAKFVKQ